LLLADFAVASIRDVVAAIRRRQVRAGDLIEECLAHVEELERVLSAWVSVDREGARAAASQIDNEPALDADPRSLLGVAVGVKDIIDVAGWPTLAASPLRPDLPANADATVVRRLREAGAIILGKTVTTEWACFDPSPTRNPWSLSHTPGGSSSGSAAAVAARMCRAALATQTGGSIIRPASYCGVAGLKPTFGRVSRRGVLPVSEHLDHVGVIARSVADLAAVLQAIAGYDPADPYSEDEPVDDYFAQLERKAPPRFGMVEAFYATEMSEDMAAIMAATTARLQAAGAEFVAIALPVSFAEIVRSHWSIMAAEASDVHGAAYAANPEAFGPGVASLVRAGLEMSQDDYRHAVDLQSQFQDEMDEVFGDVDALFAPATDTTAPDDLETTGSPKFQIPWGYAALPVVSLPAALADDGLPAAIQLVGRAFDEARLLGAAAWCERVFDFDDEPPLVAG
jgi:aspartyl-tRNA(Asn)/glutamyl-tRNA(Gln) amidotransferase subunit A